MEKLKTNKKEAKKEEDKLIEAIRVLYIKRKELELEVHEINMKLDALIALVKYRDISKLGVDEIENLKL